MMSYGERLRWLRDAKRMTQSDLAEAARVSRPAIAQYEVDAKVPTVLVAERIADALGVTIDFMVKGERDGT